ncbi:MAG TPA: glycoside hydrolase family 15 protein [Gemmatimonadaceae bacterium]
MSASALIEDYAMIGDCETAALVSRGGSIDWLCWPRFDSGACFASLLGTPEHGRWLIAPTSEEAVSRRRYRGDTMILETEFETPDGTVAVIDFMPRRRESAGLVRVVRGLRGRVPMRTELVLRFDYGSVVPWVSRMDDGSLRAVSGPDMVTLHATAPMHGEGRRTVGQFIVEAGAEETFVLTWGPSHLPPPAPADPHEALADTDAFWSEWAARCTYAGPWRNAVLRSLLTLKALTYVPTGGIVAAPTTSLPESIGGTRNWDYRFCWLRDATLTLLAFINAGYVDEAAAWRNWLLRAAAGSPDQAQIMYGISGERMLRESELPWLPGYEGSRPVRIGNAAHAQMQLDVYGEVMDVMYQAQLAGLAESADAWALQLALTTHVASAWHRPDHGIWEVRGEPQHFVFSKVMAWVAVDRAVKSIEQFGLSGPLDEWRALREEIHREVCTCGYDAGIGSFVQAYGSRLLDASVLVIPLVGFLPADDPRVLGTVRCIEENLVADGLVKRYDSALTDDGLPAGEGTFLACTLWLADNYVLQGRRDEAATLLERIVTIGNDVGLLSEEYDTERERLVGNFPQAFSHVGLVATAMNLSRAAGRTPKPAMQRA